MISTRTTWTWHTFRLPLNPLPQSKGADDIWAVQVITPQGTWKFRFDGTVVAPHDVAN